VLNGSTAALRRCQSFIDVAQKQSNIDLNIVPKSRPCNRFGGRLAGLQDEHLKGAIYVDNNGFTATGEYDGFHASSSTSIRAGFDKSYPHCRL
jgi:hypothetical protein